MGDGGRPAVRARLRRLDPDTAAALVADLWAARGFRTERRGRLVNARRDGRTRRIGVAAGRFRRRAPDGCDTVVALGGGSSRGGATVLDADDLTGMLFYAVGRSTRRRLCERHLGAPPGALRPPARLGVARLAGRVRALPAGPGALAAVVAVAALAAAAGVAAVTVDPGAGSGAAADPAGGTEVVTPAPVTTATDEGAQVRASYPPGATASFPPGLTPAGIGDWTALSRAHADALAGSYRLVVERRRPGNGANATVDDDRYLIGVPPRPGVTRTTRIAAAGDRYLLEARIAAGNRSARSAVYHDGREWYVASRLDGPTSYRRSGVVESTGVDPDAFRRGLVQRYLTTPDSRVVGTVRRNGTRLYRVEGTGAPLAFPDRLTEGYTVAALVDGDGRVHRLSADYRLVDANRTVRITTTVRTEAGGVAELRRPDWYANATRRTGGTTGSPGGGTVADT